MNMTHLPASHSPIWLAEQSMTNQPAPDGAPAKIIRLRHASGMTVTLMDIGATWLSCLLPLPSGRREVLLAPRDMTAFLAQKAYLGSMVGRYANRIANGRFSLNDMTYSLACNEGLNCLHGGKEGFDQRRWNIDAQSDNQVCFSLLSPDGDQGFPGRFIAKVSYRLQANHTLSIHWQVCSNKATPASLANHAYFNLSGAEGTVSALEQTLQLSAEAFLRTDDHAIPTGEQVSVCRSSFDFLQPKVIKQDFLQGDDQRRARGYDHAFILSQASQAGTQPAARLWSSQGDVCLQIRTTLPCLQFYTGNCLAGTPGRYASYQNHAGIALETQFFPDGPNHPEWPDAVRGILPANTLGQAETHYEFLF